MGDFGKIIYEQLFCYSIVDTTQSLPCRVILKLSRVSKHISILGKVEYEWYNKIWKWDFLGGAN